MTDPRHVELIDRPVPWWGTLAVGAALAVGLGLMAHSTWWSSATYDEVAYLDQAARWWRTGEQARITRMGSPLTFWKLQQAPTLWWLDRTGRGSWVDDPAGHEAELLPVVRLGALWVWVTAFGATVWWSRRLYGPRAMVFAAWWFALSPNLLAHGTLVTMETPLVAASALAFFAFWRFLIGGRVRDFWLAAAFSGLAFSCKFTAVLIPPLLGLAWWVDTVRLKRRGPVCATLCVTKGMIAFVAVMALANVAVTGFARLPISPRAGEAHPALDGRFSGGLGTLVRLAVETPVPQDWAGFATQVLHQRSGGSSYLLGERRMRGWWYYYFVALAVKVPVACLVLMGVRVITSARDRWPAREAMLPLTVSAFLCVTALGSSRNYGVRYLLPLAPLAIVWASGLAEGTRLRRAVAWGCLLGQGAAVASVHPHELTFFNALAGGPVGGRRVLADSNLDWGQGLKALARLQHERPEFRDLTLYYFGDTEPKRYGVAGTSHVIDAGNAHPGLPKTFSADTRYVAVSASLQWGPWGPDGYFPALDGVRPVAMTDDTTIAVYLAAGLSESNAGDQ